jgi:membrane-associated phospholipid phosphatase
MSLFRRMTLLGVAYFICLPAIAGTDIDEFIHTSGYVLQIALPLTALTATYTLDDSEGRKALLVSYGSSIALTHILKHTVNKPRPDGSDELSFPSGQVASAFSGASFLAKRYGWDIGVPAYLSASVVGYSRVHADKQDWWDVAAGAALAIGINEWVLNQTNDVTLAVQPVSEGYQIAFNVRF